MKINRLINNANIILTNNNLQNKLFSHNPNLPLSINNDNNKSNLSITTNESIKKVNSPRNNIKIDIWSSPKSNIRKSLNIDKNLQRCGSLALLSPTSSRMKKYKLKIMDEADDILKSRLKKQDINFGDIKKYSKFPNLKIKKDISLKNYIINLLQEKRTEINEKERMMNNALKEFSNQFNIDYKTFMEYVDDVKKKQKILDDLINNLKIERKNKEKLLNEAMFEYKRLEDYAEKMLKLIYTSNIYASFFHKVFNIPYSYNNLPELNRKYNFEKIIDIIIEIYEKKDKNIPLPSILKDENVITQKYTEMENIILHCLHIRDLYIKEINNNKEIYERELEILENGYKEYQKDLNYLKEDINIIQKSMKNLKVKDNNNEIDDYIDYIIELGKEINDKIPIKNIKNNNGYIIYCRKVLTTMEETEININKYINEIENILNYGEKNDKNLVQNCIIEIKKINKRENQLRLKKMQDELEKEKNIRYLKRAQRIVVKGRQASPIFPLIKHVRKVKKIDVNKNDNEIECVYSVTDEEN